MIYATPRCSVQFAIEPKNIHHTNKYNEIKHLFIQIYKQTINSIQNYHIETFCWAILSKCRQKLFVEQFFKFENVKGRKIL